MLLQTNSYVVPHDKRTEHVKLLARFRQTLLRLGCDSFEVYEQVGPNWNAAQTSGRFVQIMKFRDRRHQQAVQQAERTDPMAQKLIAEFCELINFQYQQQQSLFATSFYTGLFSAEPARGDSQKLPLEEQEKTASSEPSVFSQEELTTTPPPVVSEAPIVDLEAAPPANAPHFTDVAISAQRPEELGPEDDVLDGHAELVEREDEQKHFEEEASSKTLDESAQTPRSLIEPLEERSVHAPQDDGFESLLDEMDEH